MRKKTAFTLIELMIVVLIAGVLAAVAVPTYHSYIVKARLTEAYQSVDLLSKRQFTYYYNNDEFYSTTSSNPVALDPTMVLTVGSTWTSDWLPAAAGTHVFFSYQTNVGKTDESGTELLNSTINGASAFIPANQATNVIRRVFQNSHGRCNSAIPATSLGAVVVPNYDWVMVGAVGDLKNDANTDCTALVRLIEASPSTGLAPSGRGIVLLNMGE